MLIDSGKSLTNLNDELIALGEQLDEEIQETAEGLNQTFTAAYNELSNAFNTHERNKNNPHDVTATQAGAISYVDDQLISTEQKAVAKRNIGLDKLTNDRQLVGIESPAPESGESGEPNPLTDHILIFAEDGYHIKDSGKTLDDTGKVDTVSITGTDIPADENKNIDLPTVRVDINNQALTEQQKINAKTNLNLQNVDNVRDLDKPISNLTQAALNLKEDLVNKVTSIDAQSSNDQYPAAKLTYDYFINYSTLGLTEQDIKDAFD